MKKAYILMVAAAMLAIGCEKNDLPDGMILSAEGFSTNNTKAAVSGNNSYWVAGEHVNINGTSYEVEIDGNGIAFARDVPDAGTYYALYPNTLNNTYDGSSNTVTVTIPSSYEWRVDGSNRQVLDVPMAAYGSGRHALEFKHLTAAITVQITNSFEYDLVVDNVEVSSKEGTKHQLCGSKEIDMTSLGTISHTMSNTNNSVSITFGSTPLVIEAGATQNVQVPVLPVGVANKFTISVDAHKYGDASVTHHRDRTQASTGSLSRAEMAYATISPALEIPIYFSVGNGVRVLFSSGNLQYQASTHTWQFAPTQLSFIGNAVGNTTAEADRATQTDWIDLFGWGTAKNPTIVSINNSDYSTFYDWGDSISGGWRTLTNAEWKYLLTERTTTTSGLPVAANSTSARFVKAQVKDNNNNLIKGLIIFPDNYVQPSEAIISANSPVYNGSNTFDKFVVNSRWDLMEAAGAVFLPAAGYRSSTTVTYAGTDGYYWSKSENSSTKGYYRVFGNYSAPTGNEQANDKKTGYSVRLVKNL